MARNGQAPHDKLLEDVGIISQNNPKIPRQHLEDLMTARMIIDEIDAAYKMRKTEAEIRL